MIIFDLTCNNDHHFEGWFQSQENFDQQLNSGLVSCPFCGSIDIRRVPSAVHLSKTASTPQQTQGIPMMTTHGEMLAAYQRLLSAIVSNCEDVGKRFVDEARKIHYLEAPQRSIRGEASAEDYESLREEGIEVLRFHGVKKEDLN